MAKPSSIELDFEKYDKARANAKDAKAEQDLLGDKIKASLEAKKLDEVDGVIFKCAYKFERDKETEVFDEEKFAQKDPKKYAQYIAILEDMKTITKKYTKTVVTKGARKLIITRKNEGEE